MTLTVTRDGREETVTLPVAVGRVDPLSVLSVSRAGDGFRIVLSRAILPETLSDRAVQILGADGRRIAVTLSWSMDGTTITVRPAAGALPEAGPLRLFMPGTLGGALDVLGCTLDGDGDGQRRAARGADARAASGRRAGGGRRAGA